LDFERLQAQDIESAGIKVQLGDKTIEKMFKIQMADKSDVTWLAERARRLAAGESEEQIANDPPFGRSQRKISTMRNFAAQGMSVDDKIETILAAVGQGNSDNRDDMAQVLAQTATLLDSNVRLQAITRSGMSNLQTVITRLNIPRGYKSAGFTQRLYNFDQYKDQAGLINLFLLSNLKGRDINTAILSIPEVGSNSPPVLRGLTDMRVLLSATAQRPGKFLDLKNREVIPRSMAVSLANSGVDNGDLDGLPIPATGW
jgi:hypothetical protein